MSQAIQRIVASYASDRTRLIDMLWDVQHLNGYISRPDADALGEALNLSALDVLETASFYHFFQTRRFGQHAVYLSDTVIGRANGFSKVRCALERETGVRFGEVNNGGAFGLAETACIGLSDQEPAMMVDDVVFTRLTPAKVAEIVAGLKAGKSAAEIADPAGHCRRSLAYVEAIVDANIRRKGEVFFKTDVDYRAVLETCLAQSPDEVIATVTESNIRGRGGAGFPTGLKWRLAGNTNGAEKYIICNADEGEPGTFKDRVLLSHSPRDVLLGMVIGGHAVGARHGIVYLRAEYWYLKEYLTAQVDEMRKEGLLGERIMGSAFSFDIRIQMGAGAYICGDETALIESCEGKRGTPRIKPPYPIQQGYLGMPTVVNNVESFASVTRIMEMGARWFSAMGTDASSGARLLSVSGDCADPGIYEIEWGVTLNEVLEMVGAEKALAVQISGPSGECVSVAADGNRRLCHGDLSCNGSFMIFDETRDLLDIARQFTRFFVEESCGICTPCRAGGVAMLEKIERIIAGRGARKDLDDCVSWGALMRGASRCGLGTTAAKPILTTLRKFPALFEAKLNAAEHALLASFDLDDAVTHYDEIVAAMKEEASV